MVSKRLQLSRRTMLRGMVGGSVVALALPPLEAMLDAHGEAHADGSGLPRRLVTWFWGNGVALADPGNAGGPLRFFPGETGPSYTLTPQLQPFAAVRDYVSVLSGYRVAASYPLRRGHHDGCAILSGHPFIELPPGSANYASKFGGPTVDQVVAEEIGGQTFLPSIQLAVSRRIISSEGFSLQFISHKGPDQPLSQIFDPREAWDRLFASFTAPEDPSKPHRLAALDAVMEDAAQLKGRVSTNDGYRLDAHLDAVAQLRSQIDALAPACEIPPPTTQANDEVGGNEPLEEVNRAMSDLLALAFACDITRVASVQFTGSVGYTVYHMLGQSMGHHDMTHDGGLNDAVDAATIETMANLAYLLEALSLTSEGTGNLLDNSVVFASSDASSGLSHSVENMPVVVAGGGGGALAHPGVHLRNDGGNSSDILLSCARTVCPELPQIGGGPGLSTSTVAGLMA
ncbi:MAG: DUF1552 domain-containing protein [Myxococcales bacterium]|nr:DUF1552 domain-containing protein [Myxococcales bacterium]MCB9715401.1 DUF1552 domain-containing protein [Myxococcales bacterium]